MVVNKVVEGKGKCGYNAADDTGDMLEMGVIDLTKWLPLLDRGGMAAKRPEWSSPATAGLDINARSAPG